MKHTMHLAPGPFRKIYDGEKTIELRLNDEKRQQVAVGDEIRFICIENPALTVTVTVTAVHRFADFAALYAALPLEKCGYTAESLATASPEDMLQYYPAQKQTQYGVVGIEFTPPAKPYRDFYRFEPFAARLAAGWQRMPDTRFGQLMVSFGYWLAQKGHGDGFYLEDEQYIELFEEFVEDCFARSKE